MPCYVNQTELTSELNLQRNYFTFVEGNFFRKATDLEKIANMNWLLISLLVITSADGFLVTFGRTIKCLLYDAIHEKNLISQESNPSKFSKCMDLEVRMY